MKNRFSAKDGIVGFLIGFLGYFFVQFIAVIFIAIITKGEADSNSYGVTLILSVCLELGFLTGLIFIGKGKNKFSCLRLDKKINPKLLVLSVLIIFITFLSFIQMNNLIGHFLSKIGYNTSLGPSPKLDTLGDLIVSIITMSLVPAICEEVLFRGIVYNGLSQKGKTFAIIISSALFMMIHMNLNQSIYPLVLGIIFASVLCVTDNLWYTIISHFFNNTTVLIIGYIFKNQESAVQDFSSWESIVLPFVILIITGIIDFFAIKYLKKCAEKTKDNKNDVLQSEDNTITPQTQKIKIMEEKSFKLYFIMTCVIMIFAYIISVISGFSK